MMDGTNSVASGDANEGHREQETRYLPAYRDRTRKGISLFKNRIISHNQFIPTMGLCRLYMFPCIPLTLYLSWQITCFHDSLNHHQHLISGPPCFAWCPSAYNGMRFNIIIITSTLPLNVLSPINCWFIGWCCFIIRPRRVQFQLLYMWKVGGVYKWKHKERRQRR